MPRLPEYLILFLVGVAIPFLTPIGKAHAEERIQRDLFDSDSYVIVDENGRTKGRIHRYLWTDDYVVRDRDGRTKAYIRDEGDDYGYRRD